MTVRSSYAKAGPYLPEGQTTFPFRFNVFKPEQVRVYLKDTALEPMQGYTVTLNANGGEVIFDEPPTETVSILREIDFVQDVDLQNNTAFLAEVLEGILDRIVMMCQQIKVDSDRAVKLALDSTETSAEYNAKFNADVANTATNAMTAVAAAERAAVSEANAKASETSADTSKINASLSEKSARASELNAKASETVATEAAAACVSIRSEIDTYFNSELKELTINLIGEAAEDVEAIKEEVIEDAV